MPLYAVFLRHGPAWLPNAPLESQPSWPDHARFMDSLVASGAVLLGGPLEGAEEALLIMRAPSPEAIESLLTPDPWRRLNLLQTRAIAPWTIRLGTLPAPARP